MRIIIVTNGTVLPNADVLDALRHPKVGVRISDYGTITKKKELSELLEANHIRYWITAQKWYELSVFHKEPLSGAAFERLVSDCCKANGTAGPYIIDGKMFRCPIHAHLHRLGVFPANEKDYVDLRGTDQEYVQKRISEYIDVKRTPPSVDLCRHCDGRGYNGIEVPPAEQLAPGETIQVRFE